MVETKQKWYALKVFANQEKKIKGYVEKEIRLSGIEQWVKQVIVPTEKVLVMSKGKKAVREKNTMPGYLFIEADLSNGEILPIIEKVSGVYGFLSDKEGKTKKIPTVLKNSQIEKFVNIEHEQELVWDSYQVGDRVKILEGPFATFEGTVNSVDKVKSKLMVIVMIFARETPVEVLFSQVEKSVNKDK